MNAKDYFLNFGRLHIKDFFIFRPAVKPIKIETYLYARHLLNYFSSGKKVGLDVCCGRMAMRPFFKTKQYIGVDLDSKKIHRGIKIFPDVQVYIERFEDLPADVSGDFVSCLQAIGFNKHFNCDDVTEFVDKLVNHTNRGGTLVFNINGSSLMAVGFERLCDILNSRFKNIYYIKYGGDKIRSMRMPKLIAGLIGVTRAWLQLKGTRCFFIGSNKI